ncbi:MAG: mucoidy inhibitor MuiA family protein [Gemmata sp.]
MFLRLSMLAFGLALFTSAAQTRAQDKDKDIKPAASKVTAVTVYANTALVTREVTVPEAGGLAEVVVSPLPPLTMQSSLYAEGNDNLRVLSVRYRTRAIAEDTREEVRKLEAEIKTLQTKAQTFEADLKAMAENLKLLDKLEGFTAKSLENVTDKGQLDPEKIIAMAKFVQEDRAKRTKEQLLVKQQLEEVQAKTAFTQRLLGERSSGTIRTERDAVILLDKKPGGGTVKLNYLVGNASWRPQYKFRASGKDKDPVVAEYQAAIDQRTGEDWVNALITLSTAQPLLNAAPPDLKALAVSVSPVGTATAAAIDPATGVPVPPRSGAPGSQPPGLGAGGPGGIPSTTEYAKDLEKLSKELRSQVAQNYREKKEQAAGDLANNAAALEQFRDLFASKEEMTVAAAVPAVAAGEGPSVTYKLATRLTVPSRNDEQVIEIAKIDLNPKFYYKAVPVLTQNVYRLADLTNSSEYVLLPGDATMYLNGDFVGQTRLPLVAAGKPFTVGFGVDPQLQVSRVLVDKTRTTQGGNQVLTFKYRIMLSSYKQTAVPVQVWDRTPHAETAQTIAVNLINPKPELSTDPLYVRDEKTRGILRWDVNIDPKQNGEKALFIDYEFKMELDKNVNIGGFLAK